MYPAGTVLEYRSISSPHSDCGFTLSVDNRGILVSAPVFSPPPGCSEKGPLNAALRAPLACLRVRAARNKTRFVGHSGRALVRQTRQHAARVACITASATFAQQHARSVAVVAVVAVVCAARRRILKEINSSCLSALQTPKARSSTGKSRGVVAKEGDGGGCWRGGHALGRK